MEDAGHLHGERLGVVTLENGPDLALHARLHFAERQQRGVRWLGGETHHERHEEHEGRGKFHGTAVGFVNFVSSWLIFNTRGPRRS